MSETVALIKIFGEPFDTILTIGLAIVILTQFNLFKNPLIEENDVNLQVIEDKTDAAVAVEEKPAHSDSGSFKFSDTEQEKVKGGGWVAAGVLVVLIMGLFYGTKALFGYWDGERLRKRLELERDLQREELEQLRKKGNNLQAKATQTKVKR